MIFFSSKACIPSFWKEKESLINEHPVSKLLRTSAKYFDFSQFGGAEIWTHNLSAPGFHYDKDESIYQKHGVNVFPLCTIVYYQEISSQGENLNNFKFSLSTQDTSIIPKENRCVIMAPGLIHGSGGISGIRKLIAISPWIEKPYGLR
jgi:hypothetical protein